MPRATWHISKLPIRQITSGYRNGQCSVVSKLPIRQITLQDNRHRQPCISKLPIRQITEIGGEQVFSEFSKLPIRQITFAKAMQKLTLWISVMALLVSLVALAKAAGM